jgi:hypothetical protein
VHAECIGFGRRRDIAANGGHRLLHQTSNAVVGGHISQ